MSEAIHQENALVGNRIQITGNTNDHPFEIGQVLIVTNWYDFEPEDGEFGVEAAEHMETEHWFVRHADYIVIERSSIITEDDSCG
ncbi:hypothetical protein BVG16_11600 [Paenibacillus selenitireducens]|uniref:DUF2187 domain-containing protein n=1 Tax=Paenibacillus selenitireducens TaxID=1324314 RepID=A0A1T2XF96_9BACL|nr:hypothetical protein [Paenibacillus selenitireducens]OPA78508.1 hypothetical protein BVG16_11600 [Paenibacillus selenitireducens]